MPTLKPTANDIGYFGPTATAAVKEPDVYNDVYEFKDRLDICAQQWSDKDVRDVILECLRGDALKWYFKELTSYERKFLERSATYVEWTKTLIKRFKIKTSDALDEIGSTMYGLPEVRRGVLARQYANKILQLTRSVKIDSLKNRLNYVYDSLDRDLKQDLKAPINSTIIDEFLEQLDQHQETWKERAGYYRIHKRP